MLFDLLALYMSVLRSMLPALIACVRMQVNCSEVPVSLGAICLCAFFSHLSSISDEVFERAVCFMLSAAGTHDTNLAVLSCRYPS